MIIAVDGLHIQTCGVAQAARRSGERLEIPVLGLRECIRLPRHQVDSCILAYPTVQSKRSVGFMFRVFRLSLRAPTRVLHLHEYRRLHWSSRLLVRLLLKAWRPRRVVVSTESEAAYLRHHRASRKARIHIIPPVNGAFTPNLVRRAIEMKFPPAGASHSVGVFGVNRSDKAPGMVLDWLKFFDSAATTVHFVGVGWDSLAEKIRSAGFETQLDGPLPDGELEGVISSWDYCLAPLSDGATDGRLSIRTPLEYGIPTISVAPESFGDLTLWPQHLLLIDAGGAHRFGQLEWHPELENRLAQDLSDVAVRKEL